VTDIATLGLAVDSRQVTQATGELNKLAAAAKPAAANVGALEKAAAGAGAAFPKVGSEADKVAKSTANTTRSLAQLSFQFNDIASGLAMGQSPFMIMAQQGGQVFQVWQQNNNVFKDAAKWIGSVLTPMRVLGIAGAAAAVAGYAVNAAWNASMRQFDDTSRAIGTTINELRSLQSAASVKGIDDFSVSAEKFSAAIYQARSGAGGLAEVFRANNVQVGTFTETLARAAELIRNAKDDQQRLALLQKMGLPATMDWVRLLEQGGSRIAKIAGDTGNAGSRIESELVKRARDFDEAWDGAWRSFKDSAADAITWAKGGLADLIDAFRNLGETPEEGRARRNPPRITVTKPGGSTVDPDALQRALSLEQQRLSILGQTATVEQQVRAVELQVMQARMAGVNITDAELAKLKELAGERALGITAIKAQTDAQNVEAATIGMGVGQAAAYAAAQNALNDARREGRVLTADNIAAIQQEASALGQAAQRADQLRFGYETFRGTLQEFGQALRQGATVWDAFAKAGVSALGKIADKLMEMAAQNLWMAAFPGGGGGLGRLFGFGGGANAADMGIGNGVGSGGFNFIDAQVAHTGYGPGDGMARRYHPDYFDNAPRFHSGIGAGERAAIIRDDESVLTPGQMRAMGGAGKPIVVNINQTNNFTNADPGSEARMRQWATQTKDAAVQEAVAAVANIQATTPAFNRGGR
jgi:hypothetical protein